jgi:pilus assembly protein CpaC
LKLNVEVTELVSSNSLAIDVNGGSQRISVPSLSTRRAQSTVELADGQTIGIAGLINENLRESVTKFPGLGDIPGIGVLFRTEELRKEETELLILVTPHLVKPLLPGEIRLPTDQFREPNDFEFFLEGRMEGRAPKESTYGHDVN